MTTMSKEPFPARQTLGFSARALMAAAAAGLFVFAAVVAVDGIFAWSFGEMIGLGAVGEIILFAVILAALSPLLWQVLRRAYLYELQQPGSAGAAEAEEGIATDGMTSVSELTKR